MSFLISDAFAQTAPAATTAATAAATPAAAPEGSMASAAVSNIGLILLMFLLFYVLMIRPQQKRLQAQQEMLQSLKKGDRVLTAGGLVGTVVSVNDANQEVEIDLGKGQIVTALRYTISTKLDTK